MAPLTTKHKRDCSDDNPSPFAAYVNESEALVSPTRYGQSTISRVSAQSKKDPGHARGAETSTATTSGPEEAIPSLNKREAWFLYRGSKVRVKHSASHLSWKREGSGGPAALACGCMPSSHKLPYDEVLSAWLIPQPQLIACVCPKENSLVVYSMRRPRSNPSSWKVQQHVLNAPCVEQAKEWVGIINAAVALRAHRPRNLLVFINPFSGSKRSRHTWQSQVMPVFLKARIRFTVIETTEQAHATKVVCNMKSEELSKYQGLVAIGGDGLFQELMMGLLQHRAANPEAPLSVQRMRLGHIPGGSTDAVAYSLYNTRSPEAAALHIALGDRHPLDVARVDTLGGQHKYFVCQAAYGFLGDVMSMSEGMRALGPSRYDVAGAIRYLQLNSYRLSISYRPAPAAHVEAGKVCMRGCEVCGLATTSEPHTHPHLSHPLGPTSSSSSASQAPTNGPGGGAGTCSDALLPPSGVANGRGASRQGSGAVGNSSIMKGQLSGTGSGGLGGGGGEAGSGSGAAGYQPPLQPVDNNPSTAMGNGSSGVGLGVGAGFRSGLTSSLNPGIGNGSDGGADRRSGTLDRSASSGLGARAGSAGGALAPGTAAGGGPVVRGASSGLQGGRPAGSSGSGGGAAAGMGTGVNGSVADSSQVLPLLQAGGQHNSSSHTSVAVTAGPALPLSSNPLTNLSSSGLHGSVRFQANSQQGTQFTSVAEEGAEEWVSVEDDFLSVMTVVTPCRSDKSTKGIIPAAHLADGLMYLVMVRCCNHAQYLRFLLTLSHYGLSDLCLPFVRVIPVTAVHVKPVGRESSWNVDGELLSDNNVSIRVQRGLIDVFSRSVEPPRP